MHLELLWTAWLPLVVLGTVRLLARPGRRCPAGRLRAGRPVPVVHLLRRVHDHAVAAAGRPRVGPHAAAAVAPAGRHLGRVDARRGGRRRRLRDPVPAGPGRGRRSRGLRDREVRRHDRELPGLPAVEPAAGMDGGARRLRAAAGAGGDRLGTGGIGTAHAHGAVDAGPDRDRAGGMDASLGSHGWTFPVLRHLLPPYRGLRVPARFGAIVLLCVSLLAAIGAANLARHLGHARFAAHAALALLVLIGIEYASVIAVRGLPRLSPPVYHWLASMPGTVIVHAPLPQAWTACPAWTWTSSSSPSTTATRLLNGNSGFYPPDYMRMLERCSNFPDRRCINAHAGGRRRLPAGARAALPDAQGVRRRRPDARVAHRRHPGDDVRRRRRGGADLPAGTGP